MDLSLEIAVAEGALRVTFEFFKDRYAHRVDLIADGTVLPLVTSCEGDEYDAWPASPPIQQLTLHQHPGSGERFLLGVGMAGQSHWSLSVETDPAEPALIWDVACRVSPPVRWLGSTYRLCSPVERSDDAFQSALMESRLEWFSGPHVPNEGGCAIERVDEFLRIVPCQSTQDVVTRATIRWRYGLRAVGPRSRD